MDTERLEKVKQQLDKINQSHLLMFWDELSDQQKTSLLDQIEQLDFEIIPQWVEKYVKSEYPLSIPEKFEPADYFPAKPADPQQTDYYNKAKTKGIELISAGKVAAFVVAGGQGTRLGFAGPKGNFPVSPVKNKTLFQIFGETIAAAGKHYSTKIPWYIMCSPLNYSQTVEAFEKADYFGLDKDDIFFFTQGTNPNFSFDGKILLADKDKIAKSPDGHGGSLKALYNSSAIEHMKKRGIQYISYFQVDNPLINIIDPLFIGLHDLNNAQMSSKALIKRDPKEKVGNFCIVNGRVTVIEYSDLPDDKAQMRKPDGSLLFELGSIAIHVISVDFVEKLNKHGFVLPIHRAVKKIPHIDKNGSLINPDKPNGIKLETFVFDALPLAENSIILQTLRDEEFAPVKNAQGEDSPAVTQQMMTARAAKWLEAAGIKIPRKPDGSPDCTIEIAPSFALYPEDIIAKKDKIPPITAGQKIYLE